MKLYYSKGLTIEDVGPYGNAGYSMVTNGLNANSIVYSIGVGNNITWDLAMIERFGCEIHAFDPTVYSVEWASHQKFPPQFKFNAIGLSDFDGNQKFFNSFKEGKFDMSAVRPNSRQTFNLPVQRLDTMMKERKHDRIDVLKIDVEGLEFDILSSFIHLPIQQLLIEFHTSVLRFGQLKEAIARYKLWRAGYTLVLTNVPDFAFYKS